MKRFITFLCLALLFSSGFAQPQITWRFANPEIIRQTTSDRLEFDLQVKASEAGTYFWSGQFNLTFNNAAFYTTAVNTTVIRSGISNQYSDDLEDQKYAITRTITGTEPNLVINVALTPTDISILAEEPDEAWSAEITTEWQTFARLKLRIDDPSLIANISFIQASMNGQISYHSAPGVITNYENPNLYEALDLSSTHLGRIYSDAYGWSQVGENQIDWTTPVNTTIWDGNATITQTDNTAALANNLNVMPGANLTVGADKWLTVNGTLTTPNPAALVIADGGSLMHGTALVDATIQRTLTGGSINPTTHRYHLVSVPMDEASTFVAGNIFEGSHLWQFDAANQAWDKITSGNHPLNNKEGYLTWYDGVSFPYSLGGKMNAADVVLPAKTLGMTPPLNNSWRVVPNPYPSALEWATPAGYDAAVYFFNAATGNYITFVDGVPEPAIFPVGQSAFIKKTVAGGEGAAITIAATNRLHHAQAFYKNNELPNNTLRMLAIADNSNDETFVRFHENATAAFDGQMDAFKLKGFGAAPQVFSVMEDRDYAINALPLTNETTIVPLNFEMSEAGRVTFEASGMDSFIDGVTIFLEDMLLNEMVNLMEQAAYDFDHEKEYDPDRFRLHFMGVLGTDAMSQINWNVWSHDKYVYISAPQLFGQMAQVELFDVLGNRILNERLSLNSPTVLHAGEATRVIVARITSGEHVFTTRLIIY